MTRESEVWKRYSDAMDALEAAASVYTARTNKWDRRSGRTGYSPAFQALTQAAREFAEADAAMDAEFGAKPATEAAGPC